MIIKRKIAQIYINYMSSKSGYKGKVNHKKYFQYSNYAIYVDNY